MAWACAARHTLTGLSDATAPAPHSSSGSMARSYTRRAGQRRQPPLGGAGELALVAEPLARLHRRRVPVAQRQQLVLGLLDELHVVAVCLLGLGPRARSYRRFASPCGQQRRCSSANIASCRSITSWYRDRQEGAHHDATRLRRHRSLPVPDPGSPSIIRTWNIAHGVDVPPDGGGHAHVRRKLLREMAALMMRGPARHDRAAGGARVGGPLLRETPAWASRWRPATARTSRSSTCRCRWQSVPRWERAARPGAHAGRGPGERLAVRPRPAAGLGPPGADQRAASAARRAADRPARPASPPLRRPRVRGRQRARRPRRQPHQLERAGYVLERFARGAPMVLAGDFNATPPRRACARWSPAAGSTTRPTSASTTSSCAACGSNSRRRDGSGAARSEPERRAAGPAVRPRPGRRRDAFCAVRDQLPAIAGVAYLNAGTNGPMPEAAGEAMRRRAGPRHWQSRGSPRPSFDGLFAVARPCPGRAPPDGRRARRAARADQLDDAGRRAGGGRDRLAPGTRCDHHRGAPGPAQPAGRARPPPRRRVRAVPAERIERRGRPLHPDGGGVTRALDDRPRARPALAGGGLP